MATFLLGIICASFIACTAERLITNQPLNGRSMCSNCHHTLHWLDLIPIVSYLTLLGRCRRCHSAIPIQLLLCELLGGILAVTISEWSLLIISFLLLGLSLQDYLTQHITPVFIFIPIIVLLLQLLYTQTDFLKLFGFGIILVVCTMLNRLNKLGSGDTPVILLLWLILPIVWFSWLLIISSLIGLGVMLLGKSKQLAFIPCLSIAYWIIAIAFL